jgi:hypothetical protein
MSDTTAEYIMGILVAVWGGGSRIRRWFLRFTGCIEAWLAEFRSLRFPGIPRRFDGVWLSVGVIVFWVVQMDSAVV